MTGADIGDPSEPAGDPPEPDWLVANRDAGRGLGQGGVLYVAEIHPMWIALVEDGRTICQDAIDADLVSYDEDGSYADRDAHLDHTVTYERLHNTADLLTAVLDAGLTVGMYHEQDVTPAPVPWLERHDDGLFHFPEGALRFPVSYSLRARRPA